jgi:hypothetical protein
VFFTKKPCHLDKQQGVHEKTNIISGKQTPEKS